MKFKDWFKKFGYLSCTSCKENAREAFNYQQKENNKLKLELKQLSELLEGKEVICKSTNTAKRLG